MLVICWGWNAEMGSILFVLMFGMITLSPCLHSFKLGTWSYNQDFKAQFLGCFGTYADSLAAHAQPDKIAWIPLLCFTGEKVQIPSCAQHPLCTSAVTPQVRCVRISRGAKTLFPAVCRSRVVPESLNPLLTLCTVAGGPGKPSAASEVGDGHRV